MSFKVEVQADSSGTWASNGVRLSSADEAEAYAEDLAARWTSVRKWRVVEVDDMVTADWSVTMGLTHRY
jgi:hypothetical protein